MMKKAIRFILIFQMFFAIHLNAQKHIEIEENLVPQNYDSSKQLRSTGKYANVNQCTPWHHLKCVYTTGKETYEDGRRGKKSKHWWNMSYIGQACQDKY